MITLAMDSIPAGDNVFLHDVYHMGTRVAKNVIIMHATHNTEVAKYVIIVNEATGERMKVIL